MPIHVTVLDAPAKVVLKSIGRRARDLSAFYRGPVDRSVTKWLKDRFASEGRSGGPTWAPLRPLTSFLRSRPGHGRAGSSKVGQDVRRMWASFTKSGGPDSVRVIQPQFYERGSDNPAAKYFHHGFKLFVFGRQTTRRVPGRPIIPDTIPDFLTKMWERDLVRHIEGKI